MKKYILLPAMMVAAMLSTTAVKAQEDVNPLLKYVNKENDLKASIGGRMFADVAYYHTEWTPMKSGKIAYIASFIKSQFVCHVMGCLKESIHG